MSQKTWEFSDEFDIVIVISIVIPNFKSHNIIMSDRVYFMKREKDCKDVSIISCFAKYTLMQSKHKQTKCEHSRRNSLHYSLDYSFQSRYHYTKSKNYLKRRYRISH